MKPLYTRIYDPLIHRVHEASVLLNPYPSSFPLPSFSSQQKQAVAAQVAAAASSIPPSSSSFSSSSSSSSSSSRPLSKLALDLLCLIFSFLDWDELLFCRCVCAIWQKVSISPRCWQFAQPELTYLPLSR